MTRERYEGVQPHRTNTQVNPSMIKFITFGFGISLLSQQPEGISHKDVLDAIISACQTDIDIIDEQTGKTRKERALDYVSVWWKTHSVNSATFGRYAKSLTDYENKAVEAFNHMTHERAEVVAGQILRKVLSHKRSIDAKSSESRMNAQNKQQTLLHMLSSNKTERVLSLNEEAKRSLFESIFGGEKKNAAEN